jgi:hypothetical protein
MIDDEQQKSSLIVRTRVKNFSVPLVCDRKSSLVASMQQRDCPDVAKLSKRRVREGCKAFPFRFIQFAHSLFRTRITERSSLSETRTRKKRRENYFTSLLSFFCLRLFNFFAYHAAGRRNCYGDSILDVLQSAKGSSMNSGDAPIEKR